MATAKYTLDEFIHDMTQLVEAAPDQSALFERGAAHLERLLANPDAVPAACREPVDRGPSRPKHGTYLLHQSPGGLSITSVVWGPGDYTGPHDHGTWGMIGVVGNTVTETRWRRVDDRTQDDFALLEYDRVAQVKPGEITLLVPDVDEIHQMNNPTDRPTAEIHVYGHDLRGWQRRQYNPDMGRISWFASGAWDNC